MKKSYLELLQNKGYSIIPCDENKRPIGIWKKYQKSPRTLEEVNSLDAPLYGLVTGYNFLECIDIDLKVFKTTKEQVEWWDEFLGFLENHIFDFKDKFVVKKTKNNGYHILYKSKLIKGNTKIASLKGHTEAIIESRGIGGMVVAYEKTVFGLNYQDIDFISDEDYNTLWGLCKYYDYIEPVKLDPPKKTVKEFESNEGDIKPWDDFNNRNNVWDIVSDDFTIVKNLNKKIVIKRHNAESPHSGYIYKDDDLMYLFSTGTIYEHEKQYNAFSAYVRKHFNDDYSAAAKQIYSDGYGTRIVRKEHEPKHKIEINKDALNFPIDIFPKQIQSYILECSEALNHSVDYMGCSLLWLISVSIGNAMKIEIIPGWTENSTVWMSIVGKPGWGKTPSINRIISPLLKLNSREVKRYYKDLEKFEFYDKLTKKEKEDYPEEEKPKKNQFIANDITLEALVDLHAESDNAVGVFKDELAGWFKDMNKYREGSDLEFWLACWSSSPVILTRVTRKGSHIQRPSIPVLGGIQPAVLNNFNTTENKENGFMDRMLLCYPDLKSEYLSTERIDYNTITWYNDKMISFYDVIKSHVIERDIDGEILPRTAKMTAGAFKMYDKRHKEITDVENNEEVNEYLKSMLPKQKAYIARFALLIHVFNNYFLDDDDALTINEDSIQKAIRLSNYFIETAKKVKIDSIEVNEIKNVINLNKNKTNREKFEILYKADKDINKKEASEQLGVSLQMIYRYIKEIEK